MESSDLCLDKAMYLWSEDTKTEGTHQWSMIFIVKYLWHISGLDSSGFSIQLLVLVCFLAENHV